MQSLDQLLSRVVERRGFAVQGTDAEALFARKGDETLLAAWKTDGPLSAADAQLFLTAMDAVHATSGILVAPKGVDAAAKELVASRSVDVWAESRLVLEVGEALVHDALAGAPPGGPATAPMVDAHAHAPAAPTRLPPTPSAFQATQSVQDTNRPTSKFPSLVAQAAGASVVSNAGAAYFMPNRKKEQPADMQATIATQKGGSLGYAWGGATGGPTNRGIASYQDPHATRKVDQWGNAIDPSRASPTLHPGIAGTSGVSSDDVEITAAPKHGRGAASAAAAVAAPAMATPIQNADAEAYEIISTPKKGPAPAAVAQAPPACNTLKLNVGKEDAIAKSGAKAGAITKLALVPHVAFEYDLHLERPGIAPVAARGAILVSSLTGELRTVDGGLAWADAEPQGARKDQEKLTAVDVYEKVKGHMLKTYSKTMNVEREVAGNTVMETVKIIPDPDEMGLQHRGMVLVPVWEITGGGVNAKVDAFTGNAL